MSDYIDEERRRSQNLLIVEGNHEKNKLFWLIFKCFPEVSIDMDNVWIYGTNIYMLYEDIVEEYGLDWAKNEDDIDLPFVISKKQHSNMLRYKEDFTNIIMVFDYERHDTNFSESKILEMQKCFVDAADMGKLYINYPMIESYQHLRMLPDRDYAGRKIPIALQPGKKYKALVQAETGISKSVEFPHKINDVLHKELGIDDEQIRKKCCDAILEISDERNMEDIIQRILQDVIKTGSLSTVMHRFKAWIRQQGYIHNGRTYWKYMREIFKQIIRHNICKANLILNGQYEIEDNEYKECFETVDLTEILKIQNLCSKDVYAGFIWVLNTCVFFIAEYNFALLME